MTGPGSVNFCISGNPVCSEMILKTEAPDYFVRGSHEKNGKIAFGQ
jgi:hypothetical protein